MVASDCDALSVNHGSMGQSKRAQVGVFSKVPTLGGPRLFVIAPIFNSSASMATLRERTVRDALIVKMSLERPAAPALRCAKQFGNTIQTQVFLIRKSLLDRVASEAASTRPL